MALHVPLRASSGYLSAVVRGGVSHQRVAPCCLQAHAYAGTSGSEAEHITSVQNKLVKHCVKLRTSSKYRNEQGRIVLAGLTVLQEQLGRWDPDDIEVSSGRHGPEFNEHELCNVVDSYHENATNL